MAEIIEVSDTENRQKNHKLITIREETYKRLSELKKYYQKETGQKVSFDAVIDTLLNVGD